ncbi:coiled-coil domain-containing protein 116 isoform X1 [Octodon degus]|uniref:Coiled-coil domain-containing protein 116 isoform X1 n=1 Tax=Octodon degus TaxID=10160 RepID=A0A6P6E662_OCTDE|nr:coiled-coil domain-containing protein 116 isoform X1 [Octodon degus]
MAGCRHHSGYLADDEAGHSTHMARVPPPKKPLLPEMGPAFKLGRVPHPPLVDGSSAHQSYYQTSKRPQPFGSFLDFLTEGQVLDNLQTVVEEATERVATMKTEAGVPLVEVQDSIEVPCVKRQVRARPSFSTVKRHRVQPSLCTGHHNNYPSSTSSMSDSHSSLPAGYLGSHGQDCDLGPRGLGSLPPMKDKLLLEKNLKRLLRLENKGKGWSHSCSQRDSLLWNSLGSQTGSHWTQQQPLSWFSGLVGSSSGASEASELRPGERELIFLKGKFKKEKSLLSQPASFDLPGYCVLREPHRTLDFLAKHHLFPALQSVVSQAADKLRAACCHDGCPLFPTNSQLVQGLSGSTLTEGKEPCDSLHTTDANPMLPHRKSRSGLNSSVSNAQGANRVKLKNSNTKKPRSSSSPKSGASHLSNPCFEEIFNFLVEQAVSLLTLKYKYENNLNKQLGFISFPVTEALMGLFLGFKKVKGSHIVLSSEMDWNSLLRKLQEAEQVLQASRQASQAPVSQAPASQASSNSAKPGHNRVHTSLVGVSQHSTKSPPIQPVPATKSNQNQATEPGISLIADTSTDQLLSPWESITAEKQASKSLSQPRPFMSSDPGMGSSLPENYEMVNTEDNAEAEGKGNKEDKGEDVDSYKDKSNYQDHLDPGQEAMSRYSVDTGHGDPP